MILCQTCAHHPGRGSLCPVGHRHATAAAKYCPAYQDAHKAAVAALRAAAAELHRAGLQQPYARTLQAAHREAEQ